MGKGRAEIFPAASSEVEESPEVMDFMYLLQEEFLPKTFLKDNYVAFTFTHSLVTGH